MTEFNPPTNFIPGESTIDGINVFKPKPKQDESQPVIDFDCPQAHHQFLPYRQPGGLKHGM